MGATWARVGGVALGAGAAVMALGGGSVASAHTAPHTAPHAAKVKNADILGMWVNAPGETSGGVYTSEAPSGRCTEVINQYGPGYGVIDCKVTGDKLTFVVTYGTSYKSYNTDHVDGNYITGTFHDTNGTVESYTSVRETDIPTTATLACRAAGTKAACTTTVTYNDRRDPEGAPTGTIKLTGKAVRTASCALAPAKKADTASCTATVTPTAKGRRTVAVSAAYGGSRVHFRKATSKAARVKVR